MEDPTITAVVVANDPSSSAVCLSAVANDHGLFASIDGVGTHDCDVLRRYDLDGFTMTHEYDGGLAEEGEDQHVLLLNLTLAPGGLLFAIGTRYSSNSEEVVCFDARTLEVRCRFGRGMFEQAFGMFTCGNALFVGDGCSNAIKVFSLAGSFLRSFHSGCDSPRHLYHFDGRLYIMDFDSQATRIVVLTAEGERLLVWRPDSTRRIRGLYGIYGRKLLIETADASVGHRDVRLEALQGI